MVEIPLAWLQIRQFDGVIVYPDQDAKDQTLLKSWINSTSQGDVCDIT